MIFGINTPTYLNPAWGTVIISGIPMLLLAMTRLIREKWISSALLIAIAMVASLMIGEVFAAGAEALVAGSAVFGAADPEAEIVKMLEA